MAFELVLERKWRILKSEEDREGIVGEETSRAESQELERTRHIQN